MIYFVLYDLQQSDSTGVLIRLTSNEFTENSTLPTFSINTLNKVLLHNKEVKNFIPGCKFKHAICYSCMVCSYIAIYFYYVLHIMCIKTHGSES